MVLSSLGTTGTKADQQVQKTYRKVRVVHHHKVYHEEFYGQTTYYSPGACDGTGGGETTADGTHVYVGEVANSVLPLGTRIEVRPRIMGLRDFVVHDRFGNPPQPVGRLDVWLPCGTEIPNPWVHFRTYTERVAVFYRRVLIE